MSVKDRSAHGQHPSPHANEKHGQPQGSQKAGAKPKESKSKESKPNESKGEGSESGEQSILRAGRSAQVQDIRTTVPIKYNQIFMLTSHTGDMIRDERALGIYFHDTQYLGALELRVNGQECVSLLSDASRGKEARYELTNPDMTLADHQDLAKEHLNIKRVYTIGDTVKQQLSIRCMEQHEITLDVSLVFASHFTNMFVVRGAQPGKRGTLHPPRVNAGKVVLVYDGADDHTRTTTISFDRAPDQLDGGTATYHLHLTPHHTEEITLTIALEDHGPPSPWERREGERESALPQASVRHQRFQQELSRRPTITTSNPLFDHALERGFADMTMLATADHGDVYISAGVPWFVALFGRDSCISAFQMVAYNAELARTTLEVLARYQGREFNDFRDEAPGKIPHELRLGEKANLEEVPQVPYYGTVDATPWFLMLLAEYVRWSGDLASFERLEEHVRLALEWIAEDPTRHGKERNGFLSYGTRSEKGLTNQGWKDSGNAIVNVDGSLCQPPIALVEVQGYVYRAQREMADLYRRGGNERRAQELEALAARMRERFNERFWMADKHCYALCLERDDRQARVIASNPGQALFTRIVEDEKARAVRDRLMAEDMFAGWGIRTLSANEKAYNPLDYQVGSIWPHDNALIALGLWEYGFDEAVERVLAE
ncbi:MAG: amylo-alpha-1,6-glucosidase, partial [Ktedonobacterales bacterium]|nr:amylo-alpha-1,6-glucosidase [Ktedonobacterales bacterium]